MNEFESVEAAKKALSENQDEYNKQANEFCPIIRDKCKTNCTCYCEPYVQDGGKIYPEFDGARICYGHCTCPMITGEITANVFQ